jgi:hypothetical protein
MSTCPDTDLYSAYVDGEVPSPWKEKLESHMASCPTCRKHVERYRLIARGLKEGLAPAALDIEASFARLSARIAARQVARPPVGSGARPLADAGRRSLSKAHDWIRYSVKMPVAGLAAMFLAAVFIPSVAVASLFARHDDGAQLAAAHGKESAELKALAPTNDVYSRELSTPVSQSTSFMASDDPLFTVVDYARKFSPNDELFSDADIIIIKLPKITGFSEPNYALDGSDDILPLASGFDR